MNTILIEPTDVLFFRDAIPMSAGQGKGAGCRLPFPSTLHEAFRASLLRARGETGLKKEIAGRPRGAARKGNWHETSHETDVMIASKAFRSLRTIGPLPWLPDKGLLLPVPLDVAFTPDRLRLARLQLSAERPAPRSATRTSEFRPACLPMPTTPPDKHGQLSGWWTVGQYQDYLRGETSNANHRFRPLPTSELWAAEHRVGVQIDPASFASAERRLYAGSYLRANKRTRFVAWTEIADPAQARNGEAAARQREREELGRLDWLLLGGEFRLARLWHKSDDGQPIPDLLGTLRRPPEPPADNGPCLLKWVLVTPAIFAHGSLPGWCVDTRRDRPGGLRPVGQVCLDPPDHPFCAHLISWCIGKPRTVSGWDVVEGRAKPTLLAVPEGSVYYFLCENPATAAALAQKLHWQPRSDFYGEKGCGYGLVSFDARLHPTSPDVQELAKSLFPTNNPSDWSDPSVS